MARGASCQLPVPCEHFLLSSLVSRHTSPTVPGVRIVSVLVRGDIGHRVVVRHRLPDERLTDVVGVLEAWRPESLTVRRADGTVALVVPDDVVAAKRIPPMPLRPVDRDAIQLATALGRPAARTERLGEWLLRASSGWTGRANSILTHGDPGMPVPEALAVATRFYAAQGLPPLAQVRLGSPAEQAI